MPSRRERYQQLGEPPTAQVAVPTAPDAVPYGKDFRTLRQGFPYPTAVVAVPYGSSCRLTRKESRIEHRNRTRKIEEWRPCPISSLSLSPRRLKVGRFLRYRLIESPIRLVVSPISVTHGDITTACGSIYRFGSSRYIEWGRGVISSVGWSIYRLVPTRSIGLSKSIYRPRDLLRQVWASLLERMDPGTRAVMNGL